MEFLLDDTGLGKTEDENVVTIDAVELTAMQELLDALQVKVTSLEADIEAADSKITNLTKTTAIGMDNLRSDLTAIADTVSGYDGLVATEKLTATEASISRATVTDLNVTGDITLTNRLTADLTADDVITKKLSATDATVDNLTATKVVTQDLKVVDTVTIDTADIKSVNADSVSSETVTTKKLQVSDEIQFNGVSIKQIDISLSGYTNGYLHKLQVKANGILTIKLPEASIVVAPGTISSNYDKLYAAYETDGVWNIYLDGDIDCQALVIGDAEIESSLELKTSVRKNADSNGQPNISNTVKVAVVPKLPLLGQRNVIYVVLGDCAYYCDGQYFYEMASKKRG